MDPIFENAPVPLWVGDFSGARPFVEPFRDEGYDGLRARLHADADLRRKCCESVHIVHANAAVARLLELRDASEIRGPLVRLLPPEAVMLLADQIAAIASGRLPYRSDVRLVVNGSDVIVDLHLSMADPDDWTRVIGASVDQTDLRGATSALRESEERFRTLCENAPVMIDQFDESGHCLLWNRECEERLGWSQDEIEAHGDPLSLFYPEPSERDRVLESITRADGTFRQYRVLAKSGQLRHQLWADFRLPSGPLISVGHDITELREAEARERRFEEQMRQTQKLESLGVLAGGIAHDFNNLLVGVLGNASLAKSSTDPDRRDRLLDDIIEAARRAADLSNQMLAYSGKATLTPENVDLSALIRDLAPMVSAAASKKARMVYELDPSLPVQGDPTQLRQVAFNLVLNATEALDEGAGTVKVHAYRVRRDAPELSAVVDDPLPPGDYVCLEVTDDGSGMDEATRARMFDPFFTTKFTGRGLGLASVLGIVRSHGGMIEVDTELGVGTTCRVLLPVSAGVSLPPKPALVGSVRAGVVLLVDDEPMVRRTTGMLLAADGHRVIEARDGEEALELFRLQGDEIDLAVVDATMPGMSGADLIAELRTLRPTLPVVLVSGYNQEGAGGNGLEVRFLQKPYAHEELASAIAEALAGD